MEADEGVASSNRAKFGSISSSSPGEKKTKDKKVLSRFQPEVDRTRRL